MKPIGEVHVAHRPDRVDPLLVRKQNLLRFFYATALSCSGSLALAQHSQHLQRHALLTLTLLGSILAIWALVRFLRAIDEFERQYTHEALKFAFIGMLSLLMLEVFLENFGFQRVPGYGNAALAVIFWSIGLAVSSWRLHWRHE
jgi:hypothetical protein